MASPYRRGGLARPAMMASGSGRRAGSGLPLARSIRGEPGCAPSCSPGSDGARMMVPRRPWLSARPAPTSRL
ncbi:Uncharacterised protein [Bordetella pertussis]|nr:Uncharacterised protein [Bordetella pertussis]